MPTLESNPLDRLKASHAEHASYPRWCQCGDSWPCESMRLIRALEQAAKGLSIGSIWWEKAMEELER